MRLFQFIVLGAVVAGEGSPPRRDVPITFARSGRTIAVTIAKLDAQTPEDVELRVFDKRCSKPVVVRNATASLVAPVVRVPLVFGIVPAHGVERLLGELVVYPDRPLTMPKTIRLFGSGTPGWFEQWADAVGLDCRRVSLGRGESGGWRRDKGREDLLVVGRTTSGESALDLLKMADTLDINILSLDAEWFGNPVRGAVPISVGPSEMAEALDDLRGQNWAAPILFSQQRGSAMAFCNRRSWVQGEGLPLVEEIGSPRQRRSVVLSYVRWNEQLGRSDVTDSTFIRILESCSKQSANRVLDRPAVLVWPQVGACTPEERPVLSRVKFEQRASAGSLQVLDLRGSGPLPDDMTSILKKLESDLIRSVSDRWQTRLLVLGDDEVLDRWSAVRCDRRKHLLGREDAMWVPDDRLPPTDEALIRLMQVLTKQEVPLWNDPQESNHEKGIDRR